MAHSKHHSSGNVPWPRHGEAVTTRSGISSESLNPSYRGVGRVKKQAEELLAGVVCAIEKAGGTIQERKEF